LEGKKGGRRPNERGGGIQVGGPEFILLEPKNLGQKPERNGIPVERGEGKRGVQGDKLKSVFRGSSAERRNWRMSFRKKKKKKKGSPNPVNLLVVCWWFVGLFCVGVGEAAHCEEKNNLKNSTWE